MKAAPTRTYRQGRRAEAAQANTERILAAAIELYIERPFEQITLADVADRAGVGLQTLIRRVRTKDGLIQAVNEWMDGRIGDSRGAPDSSDPATVAAALQRQYETWGPLIARTLRQHDVTPRIAAGAEAGRRFHAEWVETAFADALAPREPAERALLRGQLIGVCGLELWLVLRNDAGLSADQARDAVAGLITTLLTP
jgi:AcrR family transcriptional regulator